MATEVGVIVDTIVKPIVSTLTRQFKYIKNLGENMESLGREKEELCAQWNDIKGKLNRQQGQAPYDRVELWVKNVENTVTEVENIQKRFSHSQQCFPGYYSNLKLSKIAVKKMEEVVKLRMVGAFPDGLFADPHVEALPTSALFVGETTEQTTKEIMEGIKDVSVRKMGIYGMGGIGKTSIMRHIYNQLKKAASSPAPLFNIIIWVTVSKTLNINKLQDDIAAALGTPLSENGDRAVILFNSMRRVNKYLLILDDLWEAISLESVGIPEPTIDNGSKIVLTTRDRGVCRAMASNKYIEVQPLSEKEAWNLFKEKAGIADMVLSPEIEAVAELVAEECNRLPLALITVGRALRHVADHRAWRSALKELQRSTIEIKGMEKDVFHCLKFSYDRLRNERIQACFLDCALYPEDYMINKDELVDQWIGEGLIDEVGDREDQKDNGHVLLMELEDACMLKSVDNDSVMMHDCVRDMAINITRGKPLFMVRTGVGLKNAPDEAEWLESLEKASLMSNKIETLSIQPYCPNLSTLLLRNNLLHQNIANSFFENLHALKFLDLSNTGINLLPQSLSGLKNLRILLLRWCRQLKVVPPVGELKELRTLDLSGTSIEQLPEGMEELSKLRSLILDFTDNLLFFRAGVISNLPHLEELNTWGSAWMWSSSSNSTESKVGATIEEILSLRELISLKVEFADLAEFVSYIASEKQQQLKSFYFCVDPDNNVEYTPWQRCIEIRNCNLIDTACHLPINTQSLRIRHCKFTQLSVLLSLSSGMPSQLKYVEMYACDGIECLFPSTEYTTLLKTLECLRLEVLPSLRVVFKEGVLSHGSFAALNSLEISECYQLKSPLPPEILQKLKDLKITGCSGVEEIVVGANKRDVATITAPRLEVLMLSYLPNMRSICSKPLVCNSLRLLTIINCPELNKFTLSFANRSSDSPLQGKIVGTKEWWDALEWGDPNTKTLLLPLFEEEAESEDQSSDEDEETEIKKKDSCMKVTALPYILFQH